MTMGHAPIHYCCICMYLLKRISLSIAAVVLLFSCKDEVTNPKKGTDFTVDSIGVQLDTLITGLNRPWGIEFIEGNQILITERTGKLFLWNGSDLQTISGLPTEIKATGQGGLLDVRKHPNYETNKLIYFCGSAGSSSAISTTLYRGELNNTSLTKVEKLFEATPKNTSGAHFGSRIIFDESGFVYLSLGERNNLTSAQDKSNHNGSVIRINDDGTVPSSNPFYNEANSQKEIFTYGHRNVQGMTVHPLTGEIWTHEHGPQGGDEINILRAGNNYGWPIATYGINYNGDTISKDTHVAGTVLPIYYWVPSIAPCGMDFYHSDSIPQWKGDLFLGALAGKHLNHLTIENNTVVKEERLLQGMARFRSVRQGPDGYLYFTTEGPGMLLRFRPKVD